MKKLFIAAAVSVAFSASVVVAGAVSLYKHAEHVTEKMESDL